MARTVKVLKDGVEVVLDSPNVAAEATLEAADAGIGLRHTPARDVQPAEVVLRSCISRLSRLASRDRVLPDRKGVPADLNSQGQNR